MARARNSRYMREVWYPQNRERHRSNVKRNKQQDKEWYREYKQGLSCSQCGEDHPACIDLHHLDQNQKDVGVSRLTNFGKKRMLEEIAKCVPLCANCHRKLHWELERDGELNSEE